jgi:hypothetical protein
MVANLRSAMTWQSLTPVVVLVLVALAGVGLWHYLQRPTPLPAAEVESLVKGKTAAGQWAQGTPYLLYFAPGKVAVYREAERELREGTWRVDPEGALCVALSSGEACYAVAREAGTLVWILPGSGRTYAFSLSDGRDPAL